MVFSSCLVNFSFHFFIFFSLPSLFVVRHFCKRRGSSSEYLHTSPLGNWRIFDVPCRRRTDVMLNSRVTFASGEITEIYADKWMNFACVSRGGVHTSCDSFCISCSSDTGGFVKFQTTFNTELLFYIIFNSKSIANRTIARFCSRNLSTRSHSLAICFYNDEIKNW